MNSKIKISIGVFISLAFSLSLFLCIDILQQVSFYQKLVSFNNLYYEPTPYNQFSVVRIIFSFYALLLGCHYGLQYYFSDSNRIPNLIKKRVLHESQFLPWVVLFMFGQLIIMSSIFPRFITRNDYIDIITDSVNTVGLLLIFAGFLNCTHSLRRYSILKPKQSWFLFFILMSLSFGYSSVSTINRTELEKMALSKNVYSLYNITLPKSHVKRSIKRRSLVEDYVIVEDSITKHGLFYFQGALINKEGISGLIYNARDNRRDAEARFITSIFHVNSEVKLSSVVPFLYEFYRTHTRRVAFQCDEKNIFSYKLSESIFYDYLLNERSTEDSLRHNSTPPPPPPLVPLFSSYLPDCMPSGNRIELSFTEQGIIHHDTIIGFETLKELYLSQEEGSQLTVFFVLVDYNQSSQDYISNKSLLFKMYYEVRNEDAILNFGKAYSDLERTESIELRRKYPMAIAEFGLNSLSKDRIGAFIEEQKIIRDDFWRGMK